jgi:hypothetical protein
VLTFSDGAGLQMYAVITAIYCALQGLVVVPIYLRKRRFTHAAGMVAYLLAVAIVVYWMASFQAN